ncbi:MAG: S41 family peptidase [Candidatus Absconditabacteria bacterium]
MKKISFMLLLCISFFSPVLADSSLTFEQFLRGYFAVVTQTIQIPDSYTSIQSKFTNISSHSSFYPLLQKAIYLNIFPNTKTNLPLKTKITEFQATTIVHQAFPQVATGNQDRLVSIDWFKDVMRSLQTMQIQNYTTAIAGSMSGDFFTQSALYQDVLYRLNSAYYYQTGIDQTGVLYGGLKGMVDGLHDPYTSFFPPVDANQFEDQLQGEFFGIGAYVEMNQPGVFIITATIEDSPAQKADLRAGDRVLQIDDHVIDEMTSVSQAIQWIKGSLGTEVNLKYLRNGKLLISKIPRAKITIPNIESKVYPQSSGGACLISLRMFDIGLARRFDTILGDLSSRHCSAYIFDLRNNPGGSLEEVAAMLDYFVPTGSPILSVKSRTDDQVLLSSKTKYSKLTGEKIRILVNKGSASASEIFAGVVREYVPGTLLVGSQTYGKGSVQDLIYYDDGSLLKYTVAKRYTGKKDINIDKIGFVPDVKIEDSISTGKDAVLDWALRN